MPTRTHVFRSLIHRLSGVAASTGHDAEDVFRTFGETVERRLRSGSDRPMRPPRRRDTKEPRR